MKLSLLFLSFLFVLSGVFAGEKLEQEAVYVTQLGTRVVVLATKCSRDAIVSIIKSAVSEKEAALFKDAIATRKDGSVIRGCALREDKNIHLMIDENGEVGYLQNNTTAI